MLISKTDFHGRSQVTVPGAKFGMSKWRHNNPRIGRRLSVAAIAVTAVLLLATALSLEIGGRLWVIPLLVLVLAGPPFGLLIYFTGPGSGWRGAWWIRLPKRLNELLPSLQAALSDSGLRARLTTPHPRSRWLRNTQVSLELDRGISIWLIPGVPGSSAGLNPRLQPLTTVIITGLDGLSIDESVRLRQAIHKNPGEI